MSIQIGDTLPDVTVNLIKDGPQAVKTHEVLGKGKVVLFAVPGAFTPTCSAKHLPGYVEHFADFQKHGVSVACVSVNDAFVMDAWGKSQNTPEGLMLLADGNGEFTRALGLELDATGFGMGLRAKRFAIYAEDGVVKAVHVEAPGEFKVSSAEFMLEQLSA